MKKENGITLISLILTITITILIVAVSINIGQNALDSTRLKGFYAQLEFVQKRVDDIASTDENYIAEDGTIVYLREQGLAFSNLSQKQQEKLSSILTDADVNILEINFDNFRYFNTEMLKEALGLSNIDYDVFIDFENRIVIAEQGIQLKDKQYHMLENTIYLIKNNPNKNVGNVDFSVSVYEYGSNKYKIKIKPNGTVGDLPNGGTVKYKKINTNYWETSKNLEIIVDELTSYDIIYKDTNKNSSVQKTYEVAIDENGKVYIRRTIKIYTVNQLLELDVENVEDNEVIVLMNNLSFTPYEYGINYWIPIGEIEKIKDKFDGNGNSIEVQYLDEKNETYTIIYNSSNNFSEEEIIVNIIPKLESGIVAEEAEIWVDGDKTGKRGQQQVKVKRSVNVKIRAIIKEKDSDNDNISFIPTDEMEFKIENPNRNTVEITINNRYVKFNINPTPSDATVIIDGEERRSITVQAGTTINWSVSKTNYTTKTGEYKTTEDATQTKDVILDATMVIITVNPTPSDAIVTINGENRTSITVQSGTTINWTVSKEHYYAKSSSYTANSSSTQTLNVTLDPIMVTCTINPTPGDATVTINGQTRSTITVQSGTTINWTVSKEHYITKTDSYVATSNLTQNINVTLDPIMVTITVNPTPNDATVTINGENRKSIIVQSGTTINWSASKEHYITKSGSYTANANANQTVPVTLDAKMVTFTVNPTPSDATVIINGVNTKSLQVMEASSVTWSVNKIYYYGESGTYTMGTTNYTHPIELTAKPIQTKSFDPGGVDGYNVNNLNNAEKNHNNTDSYAGGNSIFGASKAWLWWEFLASDIQSVIKSDEYKITNLSFQYRIYGTVNTTADVTVYVDSNTEGVANAFSSTTVKSGTLTKKLCTYSLDESSVPTAARIRNGVDLEVAYVGSGKSTLPRWYGATLTIEYVEP